MMLRATGNVSFICFFKQKTAYEMRISDWSSDVCSTDLPRGSGWIRRHLARAGAQLGRVLPDGDGVQIDDTVDALEFVLQGHPVADRPEIDRKCVVSGKSVSVRVDLGGRRILRKTTHEGRQSQRNHII